MYGLMDKVVSEQQVAFIKGRYIQEQIILTSEMINELDVKRRGDNVGLKLDITQAYDSLSWEFLFEAMRKFGFSESCVKWLHQFFVSARIYFLVDGGHVGFFPVSRGLRQGDLLSPILFFIAEDVLSRSLRKMRNLQKIMKLLRDYQESSGQVINQVKSKVFVGGVTDLRRQQIDAEFQMPLSNFPNKYLGVMLHPGRVKTSTVWGFVEMLQNRLASWIGKLLAFKDRITLIKSILCSIPIYNMSVYKWVSVMKTCERIIRNFLWTWNPYDRKCVILKWDKTCSPMEEGGLGIRRMEMVNKSLSRKLFGKMQSSEAEWDKYMRAKFTNINGEWITGYKKSSVWPGLNWVMGEVHQHTRWIPGTGERIYVWRDNWVKDKSLYELFPDDDYILQNKDMKVSNLIVEGEWLIPQRMLHYFRVEELPVISRSEDKMIWSGTMSGTFTVSSAAELIRNHYNKFVCDEIFKAQSSVVKEVWILFASITMMEIWFLRNRIVLDEEKVDSVGLKQRIKQLTKDYSIRMTRYMWDCNYDYQVLRNFDLGRRPTKIQRIIEVKFKLPEENQVLICYDGASRRNPGLAGYGFVYRSSSGEFIYAESTGIGIASNFLAEIMEVIGSAEWAVQNGKLNIIICSNSYVVVQAYMTGKLPWFFQVRWERIRSSLNNVQVDHNVREINFIDDSFAKRGAGLERVYARGINISPILLQ
ncbi:uncharacterized protein LOC113279375 [Papaver somniferum]|uniref:uncharacterized protein LOC113279375 n=1 Tax=Papaver somniferum TaxID=3469 RepID=UPI000E6FC5DB|nr:uncharacterized protein LOC113279375 [Papaver somniferum]